MEITFNSVMSNTFPVDAYIKFEIKHTINEEGGCIKLTLPSDFSYASNSIEVFNEKGFS